MIARIFEISVTQDNEIDAKKILQTIQKVCTGKVTSVIEKENKEYGH